MKLFLFIILTYFLVGCISNVYTKDSIIIIKEGNHPYLKDHCKRLLVVDGDGALIDGIKLYCDTGGGCNCYLFDTDNTFTLIDCNGQWYRIDKINGKISKDKWEWKKPIPRNYVGTFFNTLSNNYNLVEDTNGTSIDEVYKFKDPN